jgi:IS30 family transposase
MLTIEEIKNLKTLGKRKWGNSLIHFLQEKFNDNLSSESVCNFLAETHQIELSPDCLNKLKSKYIFVSQVANVQTKSSKELPVEVRLKIEQKKENTTAENLYQKIYQQEKSKYEFDLGDDF